MPLVEITCENCQQPFHCYPSEAAQGRKYCSLACRGNHRANRKPPAGQTPVGFTCKECSNPFTMMQSYLTAYRKKFDKDPLYCSMACSDIGRRKDADERNKFKCAQCGKEQNRNRKTGGRIYREQKFCSYECKVANQMQRAQQRFDTGYYKKHIKRNGYVWITIPTLSRTGKRSMMEHRYIMAQHLGRELFSEETVHHVDGNRQHNDITNLELFSSRHGPGQRVVDKVQFGIEMLLTYPDFAEAAGYKLVSIAKHPTVPAPESQPTPCSPSNQQAARTDP